PFVLASAMTKPPVGAAALSVTVPVAVEPPVTLAGATVNAASVGGGGGGGVMHDAPAVFGASAGAWSTPPRLATWSVVVAWNAMAPNGNVREPPAALPSCVRTSCTSSCVWFGCRVTASTSPHG